MSASKFAVINRRKPKSSAKRWRRRYGQMARNVLILPLLYRRIAEARNAISCPSAAASAGITAGICAYCTTFRAGTLGTTRLPWAIPTRYTDQEGWDLCTVPNMAVRVLPFLRFDRVVVPACADGGETAWR